MTGISERSFEELRKDDVSSAFMLVCEHASNHMPERYDSLGLADELLDSHIAWDPGAAIVTRRMSEILGAPALLGGASRLLYDCNRPIDAADAIPARSEIFDIPGNQNLSDDERQGRIETFYQPFHGALSSALDRHTRPPVLVTVHSFTPIYRGKKRDVEVGILHDEDPRLADAMLQLAPNHTDMVVLKNEPYGPGDGVMHTLKKHAIDRGILNVMIEVRNDFLQSESQCFSIADLLANLLNDAIDTSTEARTAQRASS